MAANFYDWNLELHVSDLHYLYIQSNLVISNSRGLTPKKYLRYLRVSNWYLLITSNYQYDSQSYQSLRYGRSNVCGYKDF